MRELRERAEPALRIACLILAGVVLYELAGMTIRWNPFRGVTVPDLPALTSSTNAPSGGAPGTNHMATAPAKGTNGAPRPSSTNLASAVVGPGSNSISTALPAGKGTNPMALAEAPMTSTNVTTNVVASSASNAVANAVISVVTNAVTDAATNTATNVSAQVEAKLAGTNAIATTGVSTNGGTNLLLASKVVGTNNASDLKPKRKRPGNEPPDMGGMGFSPAQGPAKHADLPPAVQARITRITDSEILGPVMHPMPMALLGIAGDCAFLRSDSGQTGLVKEGDLLADLKLLRIGVNRVLVEQAGQKKELTIFSGYGGDSLLPNDSTNENKHL